MVGEFYNPALITNPAYSMTYAPTLYPTAYPTAYAAYPAINYDALRQFNLQQRAQKIMDNYGVRPANIDEFKQQSHMDIGVFNALGYALSGAIIGGIAGLGLISSITAPIGAVVGALMSVNKDRRAIENAYDGYLSDFTLRARAAQQAHVSQMASTVIQPQQAVIPDKQWAADLAEARLAAPATGVTTR